MLYFTPSIVSTIGLFFKVWFCSVALPLIVSVSPFNISSGKLSSITTFISNASVLNVPLYTSPAGL